MRTNTWQIVGGLLILSGMPLLSQPAERGGIQGVVVTPDGNPVSDAYVTYTRYSGADNGSPRAASYKLGKDGSFSITSLPAGTYTLCVASPVADYLDSCLWSDSPSRVDVGRNQLARGIRLVVDLGVKLTLRVDDPGRRLARVGNAAGAGSFRAGVIRENGLFVPLRMTNSDANGEVYELLVPPGQTHHLSIDSKAVRFNDASGRRLDRGRASIAVQIARGESAKAFRIIADADDQ